MMKTLPSPFVCWHTKNTAIPPTLTFAGYQTSVVVTGHPQQHRHGQQKTTISTSTTALMHLQGKQMTSEQHPMTKG